MITPDHGFTSIEALENAIAAILAADDAARILALRARTTADLLEADLIRQKLAMVWFALVSEREARRLASPQSVAARRSG
ncbi:MAG: hypothetical protein HC828_03645 [Blastochloris sp.]|nr:hypothetical protein [Blastochloris sp.]